MSGHSKWSTIKHKKAKEDSKGGKIFTKLIREITVCAREGGGDPSGNARLRLIIEKSKAVNMPQDNITRAIKKDTGELEGANYEAFTYEGYGPFGTAVVIETLSDNKNRTVSDLRHVFTKMGGNLAETGAVSWMFEQKGVINAESTMSEDDLIEKLLDYNVDDITVGDGNITVICKKQDLDTVKKAVEGLGIKVASAQTEWVPKNSIPLTDATQEEKVIKLLESLDDLDDVQNVYANISN
jgi:YebC/PmpR family DNA-binding regulatory protein